MSNERQLEPFYQFVKFKSSYVVLEPRAATQLNGFISHEVPNMNIQFNSFRHRHFTPVNANGMNQVQFNITLEKANHYKGFYQLP